MRREITATQTVAVSRPVLANSIPEAMHLTWGSIFPVGLNSESAFSLNSLERQNKTKQNCTFLEKLHILLESKNFFSKFLLKTSYSFEQEGRVWNSWPRVRQENVNHCPFSPRLKDQLPSQVPAKGNRRHLTLEPIGRNTSGNSSGRSAASKRCSSLKRTPRQQEPKGSAVGWPDIWESHVSRDQRSQKKVQLNKNRGDMKLP